MNGKLQKILIIGDECNTIHFFWHDSWVRKDSWVLIYVAIDQFDQKQLLKHCTHVIVISVFNKLAHAYLIF